MPGTVDGVLEACAFRARDADGARTKAQNVARRVVTGERRRRDFHLKKNEPPYVVMAEGIVNGERDQGRTEFVRTLIGIGHSASWLDSGLTRLRMALVRTTSPTEVRSYPTCLTAAAFTCAAHSGGYGRT